MKGDFLNGELSVVDFEFYELSCMLKKVDSKVFENYPKLRQMHANFE